MQRAQQWLSAREQLISAWFARAHRQARAHLQARASARRERRLGGAGAIVMPHWWEYESELKRRIALETLLRRLFSVTPVSASTR